MRVHKSKAELAGDAYALMQQGNRVPLRLAAAYLGLHHYTVLNHIEKGYVDAHRIGNRWYFNPDELERFKQQGKPQIGSTEEG